jgi:multidrug resistance efflux pump
MQANVTTGVATRAARDETPVDRVRREVSYARRLADAGVLSVETMDSISRALTAALASLDELEPSQRLS